MVETEQYKDARKLADLTFHLLAQCQEKETKIALSHGLTQAEFRCLRYFGMDECVNNKSIAERMKLSPSRLTRIVDGLVRKEYMERTENIDDRRNLKVRLSDHGRHIVKQLNNSYVNIHRQILEDIENSQHRPLLKAMDHLLHALEKWARNN